MCVVRATNDLGSNERRVINRSYCPLMEEALSSWGRRERLMIQRYQLSGAMKQKQYPHTLYETFCPELWNIATEKLLYAN